MVVFDADMTLWDFHRGMRRSMELRHAELQAEYPGAASLTVDRMIEHRQRIARDHPQVLDMREVRRLAFGRTLDSIGVRPDPELVEDICRRFFADRLRPDDVYDDARPMLDALHAAGRRTAVLTNGSADLADVELDDRFEFIVRAPEHGVAKPDRRAYAVVEEQAGLTPERLAMVGDDIGPDVHGAVRAGWLAIWLNRDGSSLPPGPKPDHTVTTLADVPALVT